MNGSIYVTVGDRSYLGYRANARTLKSFNRALVASQSSLQSAGGSALTGFTSFTDNGLWNGTRKQGLREPWKEPMLPDTGLGFRVDRVDKLVTVR